MCVSRRTAWASRMARCTSGSVVCPPAGGARRHAPARSDGSSSANRSGSRAWITVCASSTTARGRVNVPGDGRGGSGAAAVREQVVGRAHRPDDLPPARRPPAPAARTAGETRPSPPRAPARPSRISREQLQLDRRSVPRPPCRPGRAHGGPRSPRRASTLAIDSRSRARSVKPQPPVPPRRQDPLDRPHAQVPAPAAASPASARLTSTGNRSRCGQRPGELRVDVERQIARRLGRQLARRRTRRTASASPPDTADAPAAAAPLAAATPSKHPGSG